MKLTNIYIYNEVRLMNVPNEMNKNSEKKCKFETNIFLVFDIFF